MEGELGEQGRAGYKGPPTFCAWRNALKDLELMWRTLRDKEQQLPNRPQGSTYSASLVESERFAPWIVSDTSEGCSHKPAISVVNNFVLCLFYGAGNLCSTQAFVRVGRQRRSSLVTLIHIHNVAVPLVRYKELF